MHVLPARRISGLNFAMRFVALAVLLFCAEAAYAQCEPARIPSGFLKDIFYRANVPQSTINVIEAGRSAWNDELMFIDGAPTFLPPNSNETGVMVLVVTGMPTNTPLAFDPGAEHPSYPNATGVLFVNKTYSDGGTIPLATGTHEAGHLAGYDEVTESGCSGADGSVMVRNNTGEDLRGGDKRRLNEDYGDDDGEGGPLPTLRRGGYDVLNEVRQEGENAR